MSNKLFLGIDLGTTNSCISFSSNNTQDLPLVAEIPQVLKPGVVTTQPILPSAMYIPFDGEFENTQFSLPFFTEKSFIIGMYAKDRSYEVPDRVVISAKSWLSQNHTDRKADILPWQSPIFESKVSPFTATSRYLRYIKNVIDVLKAEKALPGESEIVITVPASFDEIARALTVEAARDAGITDFSLLEEPLAAFYSWLAAHQDVWRDTLHVDDIVLVCDIGGGTADFTLVHVREEDGNLKLERISVGKHLLLGGDNMDLSLAHRLKEKIEVTGKTVDHWQFQSLIHQARLAKEKILSEQYDSVPVTIAGKGSSLFSSTISVDLNKEEVIQLIIEGFFPEISYSEAHVDADDLGIHEEGLPYEAEPAITKHLGDFLRKSAYQLMSDIRSSNALQDKLKDGAIFPNVILFNGGVCSSAIIRNRLRSVIKSWSNLELRELENASLHTAVSQGACYYAKIKTMGAGIKIKAGIPRSYYLGLKSSTMAIPGMRPSIRGLCVVPQGMEEGSESNESKQVFNLLTGREVSFRLFTSNERAGDLFGDIVENAEKDLTETLTVSVSLPKQSHDKTSTVPVKVYSKVNELGVLELWMHSTLDDQRWELQFDLREEKKSLNPEKSTPLVQNQSM